MRKIICFLFGHDFRHMKAWDIAYTGKYSVSCDFCHRCGKIKNYKLKD